MMASELQPNEYSSFYKSYIEKTASFNLFDSLHQSRTDLIEVLKTVAVQNKQLFKYAPEKWSIQDVILHLIDAERIFCYRALCISRNDATHFPGFNENDFVNFAGADARDFDSLVNEFQMVRNSTLQLFETFNVNQILKIGIAAENPISVRAIGFIISGHTFHHIQILNDRYL